MFPCRGVKNYTKSNIRSIYEKLNCQHLKKGGVKGKKTESKG